MNGGKAAPFRKIFQEIKITFSFRLRFKKEGLARFISHLDFTRSVLRAMARADVPFLYSQGYSPHPKISFGPPLSLGWESDTEIMEIELECKNDWKALSQRINENLPKGLSLSEVVFVSRKGMLNKEIKFIEYCLVLPGNYILEEKLNAKFPGKSIEVSKRENRAGDDVTKSCFILKVEESVKMKDVINEICESSGRVYVFVKRLSFYDKDGNRI